jgi:hypothetical protein
MTVVVALAVLAGGLLGVTMAWALFSATSAAEANAFTADALPQGNTPTASVSPANSPTVTITFTQAVTTTGNVAIPAADYTLERYPVPSGSPVVISNSCVLGGTTLTCTDTPGDGTWQYTDTPIYDSWVGTESAKSGSVLVDSTGPTVSAPIVGSPHRYVNGITYVNNGVGLTDTASDAGSGIASVTYYWCLATVGTCTSANGTQIGSPATTSPYPVTWNSQPADAAYKLVAVGLDNVGNTTTSSPALVTVDNTPPTVSTPSVNGIS